MAALTWDRKFDRWWKETDRAGDFQARWFRVAHPISFSIWCLQNADEIGDGRLITLQSRWKEIFQAISNIIQQNDFFSLAFFQFFLLTIEQLFDGRFTSKAASVFFFLLLHYIRHLNWSFHPTETLKLVIFSEACAADVQAIDDVPVFLEPIDPVHSARFYTPGAVEGLLTAVAGNCFVRLGRSWSINCSKSWTLSIVSQEIFDSWSSPCKERFKLALAWITDEVCFKEWTGISASIEKKKFDRPRVQQFLLLKSPSSLLSSALEFERRVVPSSDGLQGLHPIAVDGDPKFAAVLNFPAQ